MARLWKRTLSTVVHIVVGLGLVACGKSADKTGAAGAGGADAARGAAFRVALLTPGPVSDQSWNGGAYQGLLRVRDSLGAQVSNIQTKTPADFEENFRQYGAQGYALVFGHGFEFQDAASRVAPDYPKTVYVVTSGNRGGGNVAALEFAFEEGSYLAGRLAAAVTKTGVLGVIGGQELPPVKRSFDAFAAGARSVRPGVQVLTSYVGNWDDASAGKEQAIAQIGRRADVIFQNADAAGLGVFQAAKEAKGVYVVGSNGDQNGVAPDVTIASVVIDLPHAFLLVAREVKAGTFRPRVVSLGAPEDVVRLAVNPQLRARVPAAVLADLDSLQSLQRIGRFSLPGVASGSGGSGDSGGEASTAGAAPATPAPR